MSEITDAPPALPGGEAIAFGTYLGRAEPVDWSPAATRRRWRARQWKRWHYVSVAGPDLVLATAVVNIGWAASGFAYLFDRRRRRLLADVSVTTLAGRATVAPGSAGSAGTSLRSARLFVSLKADEAGRWRLAARARALTVDATLSETPAGPTLCAVAPVPGGVADCTHKTPALAVEGLAVAGGLSFDLTGHFGALDHTSGLLARDTRWRWASATDGRTALNLTEGFTAPYENALWRDGVLHRVPPVRFHFDRFAPQRQWRISDEDGAVDLRFDVEGSRAARTSVVVAESDYLQPVGTFNGSVVGVEVDGLVGVTEDHRARW